ncbi:MAG: hypothetical protein GC200_00100 [Tepidisphaera sp.]|nr:hypothetical protein [Tepidisphaera sp.]
MPSKKDAARTKKTAKEATPVADVADALARPTTPDQLAAFLASQGLNIPRSPMIDGHAAPFDYLAHAFFEGNVPGAKSQTAPHAADCIVWANRGGGKTFLGAVATMLDLVFKPGIEIRVLGGSFEQSKRMYAHLRRLFDPAQRPLIAELVAGRITERRLTLVNGSEVELLTHSQTSVRGTRVQKLRCDEVDLFDPLVWEAAQLTTRSKRCGQVDVVGSVECLSTMHEAYGVMYDLVNEAKKGKRALFRWGVADVLETCAPARPCEGCTLWNECRGRAKTRPTADAGHVRIDDAIAAKRRVALNVWEAEMLCRRPRRSGVVVPEFEVAEHVFHDDSPLRGPEGVWLAGMDPGLRTSVVVWGVVDDAGVLWIVDERVGEDVIAARNIEAMQNGLAREGVEAWPCPKWVAVDPAAMQESEHSGTSVLQMLIDAKFKTRAPRYSIRHGLDLLRARLKPASGEKPRLFIHARCERLIESLARYRYETGTDSPRKGEGFDHAVDALRYLVAALDTRHKTTGRWSQ